MVETRVLHRELPNLVYQLDCVSGAIGSCSLDAYQTLWKAKFLTTPEDDAALKVWKATRARYAESIDIPSEVKFPLGREGSKLSLDASVRRAGLLATSVENFVSRLDLLMLASDREAMAAVVRRFVARFHTWYQSQAKSGDAFAIELQRLLERQDVQTLINQFHTFYDAQLPPNQPLPFLVLDRPESASHQSYGEQVGGVSLIEVIKGERATRRIDVVIHELCHYLFSVSRPQTIAGLQARFLASKVPGALGAYRLFDEAVATALGNGVVASVADRKEFDRRFAKPQGFYNDADIDRSAKALYPLFLRGGLKLSDEDFIERYLEVFTKEYGETLAAPRLAMFHLLMFVDQRLSLDVERALSAAFHVNTSSSLIGLPEEPEVDRWYAAGAGHGTGLFIVTPEALGELVKKKLITPADQKALLEAKAGAMVGKPRGNGDWLYVVVAPDQAALERSFAALAQAQKPLEGLTKAP